MYVAYKGRCALVPVAGQELRASQLKLELLQLQCSNSFSRIVCVAPLAIAVSLGRMVCLACERLPIKKGFGSQWEYGINPLALEYGEMRGQQSRRSNLLVMVCLSLECT